MASIEDVCAHASQLEGSGRPEEAEELYRRLLEFVPNHPLVSYLYSLRLLARGDYESAWPFFERRIQTPFYQNKATTHLPAPYWHGEIAPGATVLIHMDQGLGDLIMCCRYLGLAAERVGKVVVAVPQGSAALFTRLTAPVAVVELGDDAPAYDMHLHAFSLPAIFGTTLATIPPPGCLTPDPALVAHWRQRLDQRELTVGICWRGNPRHPRDGERSIPLPQFAPLLRIEGIRFVSLQVGAGREELGMLPPDVAIEDFSSPLDSAAALLACLDHVITVDTAVAHLAGAVGGAAWVALPRGVDWRWLDHGDRSPWYPSFTLFRQHHRKDWSGCIDDMAAALVQRRDSRRPSET